MTKIGMGGVTGILGVDVAGARIVTLRTISETYFVGLYISGVASVDGMES